MTAFDSWYDCDRCAWYQTSLYKILTVRQTAAITEAFENLLHAIHERIHRNDRTKTLSVPFKKTFPGCGNCDWIQAEILGLIDVALKEDKKLLPVAEELLEEVHRKRCSK